MTAPVIAGAVFFSCLSGQNGVEYSDVVLDKAALVGELAVPCNLQSATAGMNSRPRIVDVSSARSKQR